MEHFSNMKEQCVKLIEVATTKAADVSKAIRSKAEATTYQATKSLTSVKEMVQERGNSLRRSAVEVMAPVIYKFEQAVQYTQETKQASLDAIDSWTSAVTGSVSKVIETVLDTKMAIKNEGIRTWALGKAVVGKDLVMETMAASQEKAKNVAAQATVKGREFYHTGKDLASTRSVQTTVASAATGAVAVGAGGGATGLATGGVVGAAAGVPFALFTFGLSIPIGAAVGGGAGLVAGATAGATAGLVGGGAAGYGAYHKGGDIRDAATNAMTKATGGAEMIKGKAFASVDYAKDVASAARKRVMGVAGTGSTAD